MVVEAWRTWTARLLRRLALSLERAQPSAGAAQAESTAARASSAPHARDVGAPVDDADSIGGDRAHAAPDHWLARVRAAGEVRWLTSASSDPRRSSRARVAEPGARAHAALDRAIDESSRTADRLKLRVSTARAPSAGAPSRAAANVASPAPAEIAAAAAASTRSIQSDAGTQRGAIVGTDEPRARDVAADEAQALDTPVHDALARAAARERMPTPSASNSFDAAGARASARRALEHEQRDERRVASARTAAAADSMSDSMRDDAASSHVARARAAADPTSARLSPLESRVRARERSKAWPELDAYVARGRASATTEVGDSTSFDHAARARAELDGWCGSARDDDDARVADTSAWPRLELAEPASFDAHSARERAAHVARIRGEQRGDPWSA